MDFNEPISPRRVLAADVVEEPVPETEVAEVEVTEAEVAELELEDVDLNKAPDIGEVLPSSSARRPVLLMGVLLLDTLSGTSFLATFEFTVTVGIAFEFELLKMLELIVGFSGAASVAWTNLSSISTSCNVSD